MTVCLLKAVLLLVCAFEGPTGVGAMWNLPVGLVACGAVSSSLGLLTLLWVTDVTPRHYAEVRTHSLKTVETEACAVKATIHRYTDI
jgi:hypothetical protein